MNLNFNFNLNFSIKNKKERISKDTLFILIV